MVDAEAMVGYDGWYGGDGWWADQRRWWVDQRQWVEVKSGCDARWGIAARRWWADWRQWVEPIIGVEAMIGCGGWLRQWARALHISPPAPAYSPPASLSFSYLSGFALAIKCRVMALIPPLQLIASEWKTMPSTVLHFTFGMAWNNREGLAMLFTLSLIFNNYSTLIIDCYCYLSIDCLP